MLAVLELGRVKCQKDMVVSPTGPGLDAKTFRVVDGADEFVVEQARVANFHRGDEPAFARAPPADLFGVIEPHSAQPLQLRAQPMFGMEFLARGVAAGRRANSTASLRSSGER